MKKFLWFISLGVCAAGLVYHFSSYAGAPQAGDAAVDRSISEIVAPGNENIVFGERHRANSRLISASVWGHCTFWYFTPADQTVSDYILYGMVPAPGTVYGPDLAPLKTERMGVLRFGAALEARARLNGMADPDGVQDLASVEKKD
jgi:hypothetical protein